tara:strand:+ start:2767 stop:5010 length:2244 start_codon:yes stop_codon:yes gene_type:complete
MGKFILRFFLLSLTIIILIVIFLTYFGLETDRFNLLIKNKANEINQHTKLEFEKTKIYLNPREFNLVVKLKKPKVLIRDSQIDLSKIDLFLSLKSFIGSDFLLERAEVAFAKNDIKDITKITSIFLPRFINKRVGKIFQKGNLEGAFFIPFNKDGSISHNYGFSGKISEASINFTEEFSIKNLTTEINHKKEKDGDVFVITVKKGSFFDLDISSSVINLKNEKNKRKFETSLHTKGKIDFSQIKKLSSLFNIKEDFLENIVTDVNIKTNIFFDLNKKFKVKNLSYSTEGDLLNLSFDLGKNEVFKEYLPNLKSKLELKDSKIKFKKSENIQTLELGGSIKIQNQFDKFKITQKHNYSKKNYNIAGFLDLTNSDFKISKLNYQKNLGKKAELSFDGDFSLKKYYNINQLKFLAGESKVNLENVKLNQDFETTDLKRIEVKTFIDQVKNNDFLVNKSDQILIEGEVFDSKPFLKSIYTRQDRKTFDKNFASDIKVDFKKILTGTTDEISNFAMIGSISKGSYDKLSAKGNFSNEEIIEISIYQIDDDTRTLQLISDRAKPFIKNFDFIKGFEGGKLEYQSTIKKKASDSNLIITDFKVSKVPALAQLLTLASLQGIADTLNGEGIRFESIEIKSNTKNNTINVEDLLAMGPAVSILMEGYVDKGKTVSLRGTLVPATKLNAIIASIPLVGDILVGKKLGEGVVGVSFKMKGHPKDIKTTVNPIKTLTPRFIVRALEKIKKEEQSKQSSQ